jgi:23S rRNA pseudouridine2605 synthase
MSPPSPQDSPRQGERIAKLLARAGIASRREVERMITEGRVAIDGEVLTTPATVLASLHGVTVDGEPVAAAAPARLFRFHKPAGLLTTERDPAGRPTIYDRLPKGLPRVMPVGRLDLATEGLLLMTTDGELKRQLELPATGVERSYRARAYGEVSQAQLEDLMLGVEIEGVRYGSINANLERRTGANVWIELTLTEGKNREVRRVLEHLGLKVSRLIRTRYGPFHLGDMLAGDVDEVRQHDLILFRKALSGPNGGKVASNLQLSTKPKALKAEAAPEAADVAAEPLNRAERRKASAPVPARYGDRDAKRGDRGGAKQARPPQGRATSPGAARSPAGSARPESARGSGRPDNARGSDRPENASGGTGKPLVKKTSGFGQRQRLNAARSAAARAGDDRPSSATPASARGKPFKKPAPRVDDDAGPLLDRPKRSYRPSDRGPRPPAKRGAPANRGPRK